MANKNSRAGGKFTGSHTSLIPAASTVCDIAHQCVYITKISPGFIKAGLPSAHGKRRVKMTLQDGSIHVSVRDNTSHQEIRIYATNVQSAVEAITRGAEEANLLVTLSDKPTDA